MAGIKNALVACVAVNGGHQALVQAKALIQHLDKGGHAVGGATGVANDGVVAMTVLMVVDANHEGAHALALAGCRDQHLPGPSLQVLRGAFLGHKDTGGLNDQVHAPLCPWQV